MNDRIVGGVCSGLADYLGMDSSVVRFLTFIAILASGVLPGLVLYFLCVLLVPYDINVYQDPRYEHLDHDGGYYSDGYGDPCDPGSLRKVFGGILIVAGVILLARMFFAWLDWRYILAGFLIVCGIYLLFTGRKT